MNYGRRQDIKANSRGCLGIVGHSRFWDGFNDGQFWSDVRYGL